MDRHRNAGNAGRFVLVVIVEYIVLVLSFVVLIRTLQASPAQVASAAGILFALFTLLNFFLASRLTGKSAPPPLAARHLRLLRDEFLYLRWYFDEILETMSSGILVVDRALTVRSMNHAECHLLTLKEKEELIGKPFRFHPLSSEIYTGEIYAYRGKPLIDILDSCVQRGESILLEGIRFKQGNGSTPKPINMRIYPWKNRQDETERLVIRMDDKSVPKEKRDAIDLEKVLARTPPQIEDLPAPLAESIGLTLQEDCETVRDHLEALLASSSSLHQLLDGEDDGPEAEFLLFEMQVRKIMDIIRRMEAEIGKGIS